MSTSEHTISGPMHLQRLGSKAFLSKISWMRQPGRRHPPLCPATWQTSFRQTLISPGRCSEVPLFQIRTSLQRHGANLITYVIGGKRGAMYSTAHVQWHTLRSSMSLHFNICVYTAFYFAVLSTTHCVRSFCKICVRHLRTQLVKFQRGLYAYTFVDINLGSLIKHSAGRHNRTTEQMNNEWNLLCDAQTGLLYMQNYN